MAAFLLSPHDIQNVYRISRQYYINFLNKQNYLERFCCFSLILIQLSLN